MSSESQAGVTRGTDALPTNKVKAWLLPNVPETVTVVNTNESHNMAHREGQFQVKFHGSTSWEESETLGWGERRTYETGLQPLSIRNNGRVSLSLEYE
jgi:hypothetical protein